MSACLSYTLHDVDNCTMMWTGIIVLHKLFCLSVCIYICMYVCKIKQL